MSKRTYRDANTVESKGTRNNGNGNRNSRKIISRSELDKIASEEGFHFLTELGLGNSLYANKDETLKRVYDKYGNVVSTYTPRGCLQNTSDFHNPIACLPATLTNYGFRQYTGNGRGIKIKKKSK